MTVEIDGPVGVVQLAIKPLGPLKVQVGIPVGATDPLVPVMVPVKIMICPLPPDDCRPVTAKAGGSLLTLILIWAELIEL